MYTILALLLSFGFYLCYATSKRMRMFNFPALSYWSSRNSSLARSCGVTFMLFAAAILIYSKGILAGILIWLLALMCIASLTIFLAPLRLANKYTLSIAFVLLLITDIIL